MENDGFPLDVTECDLQIKNLQERVDWTDKLILPFIPPKPKQSGTTVNKVYKINGDYTKQVSDWISEPEETMVPSDIHLLSDSGVAGPFNRIEFVPINLGSSKQVNEWLLSNGWKPKEWNYKKDKGTGKEIKDYYGNRIKTTPKLTDESLEDLEELGQAGRLIAYRRKCLHKRNQLQGFLRNLRDDGCVPSVVNTLGAATGRMTHSIIANVPAPKKGNFYKGMRKVFYAPNGYLVVGADADQCQVRGLAHYMNDLDFNDRVNGPIDLHQANADIAGVSRGAAKNIYYGYIFGAGIPKTASQIGCSEADALKYRDLYETAIPMIKPLVAALGKYWRKHGHIVGLDGRKIYANSEHMLLCYLLQNFEATLMKWSMVITYREIKRLGLDARFATFQHDEFQMIVREDQADQVARILESSMEEAGTIIGSRCIIKGEAEIGKTWYDTH